MLLAITSLSLFFIYIYVGCWYVTGMCTFLDVLTDGVVSEIFFRFKRAVLRINLVFLARNGIRSLLALTS